MSRKFVAILAAILGTTVYGQQADWYPFTSTGDPAAGEIGMQDWMPKPAGALGRITRQDDVLLHGGKPIKLWGLNLCYAACTPAKELADKRAAFYPKYGINTVRLHKFTENNGYIAGDSAAEFDPAVMDKMDYQIAKFKDAGIYVTLSVHFGAAMMGPADKKYIPYINEFGSFEGEGRGGKPKILKASHSALFYSPELQDLHIAQMVNILKHKNPHTGMTYADDPAVAFLEIVNEQSILFFTSMGPLQKYPTIRKNVGERFTNWLVAKYGSGEKLMEAWGGDQALNGFERDGFKDPESVAAKNILPLGNPWYFDPANLNTSQTVRKQRLLDTLEFLTMLQKECYDRYVKAVRDAGYKGEVLGSNWQAGKAFSHYANLWTDYTVGTIDRHNYFGGGDVNGKAFNNGSMLAKAGSGMLSSGMQQVVDRPFMLSEWIHVIPNEWRVEGPAIIGAYGMGLQGWDVSYMFQNNDSGAFSTSILRDRWDVTAPQVLGVFPAVSRQVLRGDVKQSDVVVSRNVHVPSLYQAKLSFDETVKQGYDDKEIDSAVIPAKSLAAVRSVVKFTDSYQPTPPLDMGKYTKGDAVVSSTGQLQWKEGASAMDGYFTINTPGTQAVVGFAKDVECKLGNVTITPGSNFAALYVSAQGPDETIASGKKLIVTAVARARNTGMTLNEKGDAVTAKGKAPVLLEPVSARIQLAKAPTRVIVLDHDGKRTDRAAKVDGNTIQIDGTQDKSPYYLIEMP